jgi:NAD(P)-dependent dehydrogenase (short-subunit alcohol dehydrogenase family)
MTTGTCIVTGANSGLGLATVKYLASHEPNLHIILACRTESTAKEAIKTINNSSPKASVEYINLDLGDLSNIRKFGAIVKEKRESGEIPPITIIIGNAGTQVVNDQKTKDGFEATFGANHLGHFLFTHLMLRLLDPKHPTRIIFVASGTHDPAEASPGIEKPVFSTPELLAHPIKDDRDGATVGGQRYSTSKLCNVLHTYELVKRMKEVESLKSVTVNAICPGLMFGTGLARDRPWFLNFLFVYILPYTARLFELFWDVIIPCDQSAEYLAKLVTEKEFAGVTGKYMRRNKIIPSSKDSYDEEKQRILWDESIRLVGLQKDETVFE